MSQTFMSNSLEIDCSPWLNEDGTIEVDVYFGANCEPPLEQSFLLKEMVDAKTTAEDLGYV